MKLFEKKASPKTDTLNDTPTPLYPCCISLYQIASLNFEHGAMGGLDDVDDPAHQRFGREDPPIVGSHRRGEFVEKIFVNPAYNVVLNLIRGAVVE